MSAHSITSSERIIPLIVCLSLLVGTTTLSRAAGDAREDRRPNIVLIMADDMGYSDLGCYGGEIETPNLDRLASGGLRFSQFYNCALCGPTRASLMTGLYNQQVGIRQWTGTLNDRCATIVELLKAAGYSTLVVGRLEGITADDWRDPERVAQHADHFFGTCPRPGEPAGAGNYFKPIRNSRFVLDGKPHELPPTATFYKTDLFTDYAVKFIDDAVARKKPFLLYAAYSAPHWPLHAKPDDIAKYRRMYAESGWDKLRQDRRRRLIELGLIGEKCRLTPRDARAPAWEKAEHTAWEAERMAVYAAQIDCLDQNIGRLLETVRRAGVERNTLVLFLSDNGASDQAYRVIDQPGRTWRLDGTPTRCGNDPSIMPGGADTFVTYGPPWANVSNTPFRQYKATCFEGGIAAPLIAYWPEVIEQKGRITHQPAHLIDIMPTCLELAGTSYPERFRGRSLLPLEGASLVPIFQGGRRDDHEVLCWNVAGSRAVRMGRWKLVAAKGKPWELYDLQTDRSEMDNQANNQPDRVREMSEVYVRWAKRVGIAPNS
ncbi:MAG: arylsulfatase [Thermoguttaceae bacterium]